MSLESVRAEWMEHLTKIGGLYTWAVAARAGMLDANFNAMLARYYAQVAAEAAPFAVSAGAGAVGAGAVPVIFMVYCWMALGADIAAAREAVKSESSATGFSQGFVMGLLRWNYDQVLDRFRRPVIHENHFDEALDEMAAFAFENGLRTGFIAGLVMPAEGKRAYLRKMSEVAGVSVPNKEHWRGNRLLQIDYVIRLAAAARRSGLIKQ